MITHLRVGFALRCFQRLSFPDIATQRCPWQDSWQTSGQFTPVLSSRSPLFLGAQTIPSPVPDEMSGRGRRHLTCTDRHSLWSDSLLYKSEYLSTQVVTGSNQAQSAILLLFSSFS